MSMGIKIMLTNFFFQFHWNQKTPKAEETGVLKVSKNLLHFSQKLHTQIIKIFAINTREVRLSVDNQPNYIRPIAMMIERPTMGH